MYVTNYSHAIPGINSYCLWQEIAGLCQMGYLVITSWYRFIGILIGGKSCASCA